MRWHAQVAHVAWKDVRVSRWLWLAYVAAVLFTTAHATQVLNLGSGWLWVLAVLILGALLVGTVVHADAPTRADAFWATRPLHPGAVYGAKIALAGVLLLLPLAGEFIALLALDVTAGDALSMLLRPVAVYAALLATAVMIAVLVPDVRLFAAAFVAVYMAESVMAMLLSGSLLSRGTGALPVWFVYLVTVGGMLLLGLHQYRTRDVRRGIVFAVLLMMLSVTIPISMLSASDLQRRAPTPLQRRPPTLLQAEPPALRVVVDAPRRAAGGYRLGARVGTVGAPAQVRYAIGSIRILVDAEGERTLLTAPVRRFPAEDELMDTYLDIELTEALYELLQRADARLVVEATVVERRGRVLIDLPVTPGASAAGAGNRLRLQSVEQTPTGTELTLRHSMALQARDRDRSSLIYSAFELVNERRRENVRLTEIHESVTRLGLVLPASHALQRTVALSPVRQAFTRTRESLDDAWLAQARLHYVEWTPISEHTSSAEAVIPRAQR